MYRLPLLIDSEQEDKPSISSINYDGVESFLNGTTEVMIFNPKVEHAERIYNVKIQLRDFNSWKEKTS
jgi:hypothetical protein